MKDAKENVPVETTSGAAGSTDPATAVLVAALESARSQANEIEAQIGDLQRKLHSAQEEAGLIERLLKLRGVLPPGSVSTDRELTEAIMGGRRTNEMVEEVIGILEELEHPLPISEILRLLKARQVKIPGAGTQANLISYLTRDSRIVRPSRGVYALGKWGVEQLAYAASKKQSRKRRRRRRARSTKS
jgi:hypothetical protein